MAKELEILVWNASERAMHGTLVSERGLGAYVLRSARLETKWNAGGGETLQITGRLQSSRGHAGVG